VVLKTIRLIGSGDIKPLGLKEDPEAYYDLKEINP
tara:strand:- start:257 stop:361 length:105 start_codon:yes stop_codon:yes gene_type:complete